MYVPAFPVENGMYYDYIYKLNDLCRRKYITHTIIPHGIILSEKSKSLRTVNRIAILPDKPIDEVDTLEPYILEGRTMVFEYIRDVRKLKTKIINVHITKNYIYVLVHQYDSQHNGGYHIGVYDRKLRLIKVQPLPEGIYFYDMLTGRGDLSVSMWTKDGYIVFYYHPKHGLKYRRNAYYQQRTILLPENAVPVIPHCYAIDKGKEIMVYNYAEEPFMNIEKSKLEETKYMSFEDILYMNLNITTVIDLQDDVKNILVVPKKPLKKPLKNVTYITRRDFKNVSSYVYEGMAKVTDNSYLVIYYALYGQEYEYFVKDNAINIKFIRDESNQLLTINLDKIPKNGYSVMFQLKNNNVLKRWHKLPKNY
jgi:hypothetical protein